jgi:hypothetical protein
MKKLMTILAFSVIAIIACAQPDLSGTWKLNKEKSKLNDQFSMAPSQMTITQNGNDLAVVRQVSFQDNDFTISDKFTLDGKECINPGMMDTQKKSVVTISEDKKSVIITSKIPMQEGDEMTIKEIFSIQDGNLIFDSSSSSSFGDMSEKIVFDKI